MVTAPSNVHTAMSTEVNPHVDLFAPCVSKPQRATLCVPSSRPTSMENRCSEHGLAKPDSIYIPLHGSSNQDDTKDMLV